VAAFDTETANGTLNPSGRGLVYLSDGLYTCLWNGSAWEYYHAGLKLRRPFLADFTGVNTAGATATGASSGIYLRSNNPGDKVENYHLWVRSTPAAPYTVTLIATLHFGGVDYNQLGLVLRESSTGKFLGISIMNSSTTGMSRRFGKYTSATAISGDYVNDSGDNARQQRFALDKLYLRATVDATSVSVYWSHDGLNWDLFGGPTVKTDFLASGPNQFGIYISGGIRYTYAHILECSAV
jgi:hypothetical protein